MLIGYARVSTQDQNLDLQKEALTKAGCQKIFVDKVSGSREERPVSKKPSKYSVMETRLLYGNWTAWAGVSSIW